MANSNGWGDGAANNAIGWGQGANNNIGWGSSHATSWAGATDIVGLTTDADAQAFITAAAITDATQQTAINNLVVGMKADGIWTKMKAIYPFVGGTATTHKWNLKDPRDLDAAFRLVFNGGWTHSSTGATPNGVNGYADTKLNAGVELNGTSAHASLYPRTSLTGGYGIQGDFTSRMDIINFAGVLYSAMGTTGQTSYTGTYAGLIVGSRTSSTSNKLYVGGTLRDTKTNLSTANFQNSNYWLGACNVNTFFSSTQTAFASIGDGLTDTEAANLYTRVQAFQTSLSRQV